MSGGGAGAAGAEPVAGRAVAGGASTGSGAASGAAAVELEALAGAPAPCGLYVHFPFCARRCPYCGFSVTRSARPPTAEWLACLEADARAWFAVTGWRPPVRLETIFVGGGTPSLLGGAGMSELAVLLRRHFAWDADGVEWSVEANPGSLTAEACERWRAAGVTRLSVGVQSFDDAALRWLGRSHDAAEGVAAVRTARAAGFEEINVDLIFGLPAGVRRDWVAEVERAAALGVTHVSAYGLSAEPRTPLGRRVELGRVRMAAESDYEREYLSAAAALTSAGYEHYEVSNFCRPGREARHNWQYWDGAPYLGLGPSSHSFLPPLRVWNAYRWDAYRKAVRGEGELRGLERLPEEARALERLWLGLRTRAGVAEAEPAWRRAVADGRARGWEEAGWLIREAGRVRLTPTGWLRMDAIAADLAARVRDGGRSGGAIRR